MNDEMQPLPFLGWMWKFHVLKALLKRLPDFSLPESKEFDQLADRCATDDAEAIQAMYYGWLPLIIRKVVIRAQDGKREIAFFLECLSGCLLQAIVRYAAERDGDFRRYIELRLGAAFVVTADAWKQARPKMTFESQIEAAEIEENIHFKGWDPVINQAYYERTRLSEENIWQGLHLLKQRFVPQPEPDADPWSEQVVLGDENNDRQDEFKGSDETLEPVDNEVYERFVDPTEPRVPNCIDGCPDLTEIAGRHKLVEDPQLDFPEEDGVFEREHTKALVRRVIRSLSPREEKVLRLRFGIDEPSEHTFEEVGQEFEVTRERIRQIEAKALRRLRHPSRSRWLRPLVEEVAKEPPPKLLTRSDLWLILQGAEDKRFSQELRGRIRYYFDYYFRKSADFTAVLTQSRTYKRQTTALEARYAPYRGEEGDRLLEQIIKEGSQFNAT